MAPKDSDAPANRDFELLVDAVKSMKSEIAIDYDKLAERRGLKNAASARAGWHSLKNKYGLVSDAAPTIKASAENGASKPAKGKKRKADVGHDDDETVAAPNAKKGKKGGRKATATKIKEEEAEELPAGGTKDETPVKAEGEEES